LGFLRDFDNLTVFHLMYANAAPLVLPGLTSWIIEQPEVSDEAADAHIDRVLDSLFGHRGPA